MAHTYCHLFGLPTTGLRFFTVYGPWGRPDMALFLFTQAISSRASRSTCSTTGITCATSPTSTTSSKAWCARCDHVATPNPDGAATQPDPCHQHAPYRIYNIGNNQPVRADALHRGARRGLGRKANKNLLPLQPGDVPDTYADVEDLVADVGYSPATPVEVGV